MTNIFKPILRPALPSEAHLIRDLIRRAQINPLGLEWRRFMVALSPEGEFTGCAQLKIHFDGSRELASLAVEPAWRDKGVGSALVRYWLQTTPGPIYLTCRKSLGAFYRRFGFQVVQSAEMPTYFRWLHRAARLLHALKFFDEPILVMKHD